ncbi:unnamed protein product, partial [Cylicostephanus goldi]
GQEKNFQSDNEWIVEDIIPEVLTLYDSKEDFTYPSALFTFQIRRFSLIYVVTIIIPSFVLTFLCVLGMFWSKFDQSDYLAKIGCGLSAILAMCTVLEIAERSIPKTKELPSLAIYIMVNLLLVTLAITVVVIASNPCRSLRFDLCRLSRRWFCRIDLKLEVESRVICLLVFPIAAVLNLLMLVPRE